MFHDHRLEFLCSHLGSQPSSTSTFQSFELPAQSSTWILHNRFAKTACGFVQFLYRLYSSFSSEMPMALVFKYSLSNPASPNCLLIHSILICAKQLVNMHTKCYMSHWNAAPVIPSVPKALSRTPATHPTNNPSSLFPPSAFRNAPGLPQSTRRHYISTCKR
jgi:hypothetical protein